MKKLTPKEKRLENQILSWIKKAEDNLSFAKMGFRETKFYDQVCLLCQQAVEKFLKAFILKNKQRLDKKDKIHNLVKLGKKCKDLGLNLDEFNDELRILSEFYIPARYPVDTEIKFKKEDAGRALKIAREIIEFIKNKVV